MKPGARALQDGVILAGPGALVLPSSQVLQKLLGVRGQCWPVTAPVLPFLGGHTQTPYWVPLPLSASFLRWSPSFHMQPPRP